MIKWLFPPLVVEFALEPGKSTVAIRKYRGRFYTEVIDLDVTFYDDNISLWCRENCRGRFKIEYLHMDNDRWPWYHRFRKTSYYWSRIPRVYGERLSVRASNQNTGVFLVGFSDKKDATMFRLTFNDIYTVQ